MTPGEVLDEILSDPRLPPPINFVERLTEGTLGKPDLRHDPMGMFFGLMKFFRPDPDAPHHTPLSPEEISRLRAALPIILDSINAAYARNPAHFYVVKKGGR